MVGWRVDIYLTLALGCGTWFGGSFGGFGECFNTVGAMGIRSGSCQQFPSRFWRGSPSAGPPRSPELFFFLFFF